MSNSTVFLKIDADRVVDCLQDACVSLDHKQRETVLDFSLIQRIDPSALRAMEVLAGCADDRAVKIALFGVNVRIYKVLKLAKLAPRFRFLSGERGRAMEEESCHAEPSQR